MKKLLSCLAAICLVVAGVSAFNLAVSVQVEASASSLVNISQGKEVYSPNAFHPNSDPELLVDGSMEKWCPSDFQVGGTENTAFVVIKLGDDAVKAHSFRLFTAAMTDDKYFSIRSFKMYTTDSDEILTAAKDDDLSAYDLVYDSEVSDIPVFEPEQPSGYINVPVWPLPEGVTYDSTGDLPDDLVTIRDMYTAGTDFVTTEPFQADVDAKYLIFQVTGNMDPNPRVPELQIFQDTSEEAPSTDTSEEAPSTGDGFNFIAVIMLALAAGAVIFVSKKRIQLSAK